MKPIFLRSYDPQFIDMVAPTPKGKEKEGEENGEKKEKKGPPAFPTKVCFGLSGGDWSGALLISDLRQIVFCHPFDGFKLPESFLKRKPAVFDLGGLLRRQPLERGLCYSSGFPEINPRKPFHAQNPPICLAHYLSEHRCPVSDHLKQFKSFARLTSLLFIVRSRTVLSRTLTY